MEKDYRELYEKITNSDWFKKAYHNKSLGECPIVVEELEESEDERIRKSLIKDFRNYYEMYDKSCGEPKWGSDCLLVKDILDWLEKQKEKKPVSVVRIPKFRVGDIIQHKPLEKWDRSARINSIDENGYNIDYTHLGDNVSGGYIGFAFENDYELVEQKPTEFSGELEERLKSFLPMSKQEWSEEDKTRLKVIKEELESYIMINGYGTPLSVDDIEWLKNLPERFNLQPKQEWSKEEQQIIEDAASTLINFSNTVETKEEEEELCELASKLQDLKPHWKPSKEQLEALYHSEFKNFEKFGPILESLYNDLKSL